MPRGERRTLFLFVTFVSLGLASALAFVLHGSGFGPAGQRAKPGALNQNDPCYPVTQLKQFIREQGGDPEQLDCLPLHIYVTWKVDERDNHWMGRTSWVRYTLEEDYGGYLQSRYESGKRKTLEEFSLAGPSPEASTSINVNLTQLEGNILGSREVRISGHSEFKEFPIPGPSCAAVTLKDEDESEATGFWADSIAPNSSGNRGGVSSPLIALLFDQFIPKPYGPVARPASNWRIDNFHGWDLTFEEIKQGLRKGELVKVYSNKGQTPASFGGIRTDQATWSVEARVRIIFGAFGRPKPETVNQGYVDTNCPGKFGGKVSYDIEFNGNTSVLNIVLKIKLNKTKAIPYKLVDVFKTAKGNVSIYVGPITEAGKKAQPAEIPDDQLQRLKELWEMSIESAWNDRFVLKRKDGKGESAKMNFDVQFIDTDESGYEVHDVDVIPGEGRSDAGNWYVGEDSDVAAHEFGHLMGIIDEYYAPKECPGRPRPKDDNIMANSVSPPRARHYQRFADWLARATKTGWEVVKAK